MSRRQEYVECSCHGRTSDDYDPSGCLVHNDWKGRAEKCERRVVKLETILGRIHDSVYGLATGKAAFASWNEAYEFAAEVLALVETRDEEAARG